MKKSALLFFFVFTWLICNQAFGESTNVFRFKGVPLGITEPEIKQLLPTASLDTDRSSAKTGILIYAVKDDENPPGKVTFTFLDGSLIRMEAYYSDKDLAKIGGWEILRERLKERIGNPSTTDVLRGHKVGATMFLGGAFWNIESEDTSYDVTAKLIDEKASATVFAVRSSLWQKLKERQKSESQVGF